MAVVLEGGAEGGRRGGANTTTSASCEAEGAAPAKVAEGFLAGMRGRGAAAAPVVDGTGCQDKILWS